MQNFYQEIKLSIMHLSAIKAVGYEAISNIVAEREKNGILIQYQIF